MLANASAQVLLLLQTYGALAVLGAILVIGIVRIVARLLSARKRAKMTHAFRERFDAFVNSSGEDTQAYERLAFLAERMGSAMGNHALVDGRPPFATHGGKAYVTVLQFIPELRRHFADIRGGGLGVGNDSASWIYHSVDDALIRFLGALDEVTTASRRKLVNPIAWFREGVEGILALPIYLASWFGLIEPARAAGAEQHTAFRAITSLVALIAVATIASILIFGEQKTAAAYRTAGSTAVSAVDGAATAVVSAFSDVSKAITTPKEP